MNSNFDLERNDSVKKFELERNDSSKIIEIDRNNNPNKSFINLEKEGQPFSISLNSLSNISCTIDKEKPIQKNLQEESELLKKNLQRDGKRFVGALFFLVIISTIEFTRLL